MSAENRKLAEQLAAELGSGRALPRATLLGLAPGVEGAYALQRQVVDCKRGERAPAGFKAGLTSPEGQRTFGVDHPLFGVLLPGSDIAGAGATLTRAHFHNPLLEMEIGYRLREPVSDPVPDIASLQALVAEVLPVIEVPDLAFDDLKAVSVEDIVAIDVGASRFIVGNAIGARKIDVEVLGAALWRDGEKLTEGISADAMGNQWQSLQWLINAAVSNGWTIEPEQTLITGAMGKVLPATSGSYRADFGALGEIAFAVS